MTKQKIEDPAVDELELAEPGAPVTKNEWLQASREIKRDAQNYRWRVRLAEIIDQFGDLASAIGEREATIANLTTEQKQLEQAVGAAREHAAALVADAEQRAAAILADADTALHKAADELEVLQVKRDKKLAELEDADKRLRETRRQMAELKKHLAEE